MRKNRSLAKFILDESALSSAGCERKPAPVSQAGESAH